MGDSIQNISKHEQIYEVVIPDFDKKRLKWLCQHLTRITAHRAQSENDINTPKVKSKSIYVHKDDKSLAVVVKRNAQGGAVTYLHRIALDATGGQCCRHGGNLATTELSILHRVPPFLDD